MILMKSLKRVIQNVAFVIMYVSKHNKLFILICLGTGLFSLIGPLTDVWGPKQIIDLLTDGEPYRRVLYVILLVCSLELLKAIGFSFYNNKYLPKAEVRLKANISLDLFQRASKLDLECYESPAFYNKFTMALREADNRFISLLNSLSFFIGNLLYLSALIVIVMVLDPVLLMIIVLAVISMFVTQLVKSKIKYKFNIQYTPHNRRMNYVNKVFYEPQFAKEIRIFNISRLLTGIYNSTVGEKSSLLAKQGNKTVLINIIADIIRIGLLIAFVMIYVSLSIYRGMLTPGAFIALFISIMQATSQLIDLISGVSEFYEHSLFIENFRTVINYKSNILKDDNDKKEKCDYIDKISFKDIAFMYVGASKNSIDGISFDVKNGEKIAIVGHNGAGKSTLIKLLLRLYDVKNGEILINGTNIKNYDVTSVQRKIGIIFQDFQSYAISIAENILLRSVESENDERIVNESLRKVGLLEKVHSLEQ